MNDCWILSNTFLYQLVWLCVIFHLYSFDVVDYIDGFLNMNQSCIHEINSYWVIMYNFLHYWIQVAFFLLRIFTSKFIGEFGLCVPLIFFFLLFWISLWFLLVLFPSFTCFWFILLFCYFLRWEFSYIPHILLHCVLIFIQFFVYFYKFLWRLFLWTIGYLEVWF